jgi:large subunit ribosomal protein L21
MTRQGHRQWFTEIKITEILAAGAKAAPAKKAATTGGDDLTKISGVEPLLVGKLNDNGITAFAQIAAWRQIKLLSLTTSLILKVVLSVMIGSLKLQNL